MESYYHSSVAPQDIGKKSTHFMGHTAASIALILSACAYHPYQDTLRPITDVRVDARGVRTEKTIYYNKQAARCEQQTIVGGKLRERKGVSCNLLDRHRRYSY